MMDQALKSLFFRVLTLFTFSTFGTALADTQINLSNVDNDSFSSNVGTPGSVVTSGSGDTRLVTYSLSNLDLAEDGSANDSLTFTIRVAANGGIVSDFSNNDGSAWGVSAGAGDSIILGEGLSFSLVSSEIDLGNSGSDAGLAFLGFTRVSSWFANGDIPRITGASNATSDVDNFGSRLTRGGSNVETTFGEATDGFSVRSEGPAADGFFLGNLRLSFLASPLTELNTVFDQLTAHLNGTSSLSAGQIQTLTTTLRNNIRTVGANEAILNRAIEVVELYESVRGSIFSGGQFNREQFNTVNNALRQASLDLQQGLITHGWTAENIRRYPDALEDRPFLSANFFPGFVAPPTDPEAVYQVQINANVPRQFGFTHIFKFESARRPTGAYLAPGSIAKVTVPSELINKGYRIRVNAHVHELTRLNFYRRMDFISKVFPITSETTEIASPIGGGIYIEVPYGEEDGLQTIQFQNTVRAPFYSDTVARQTTLDDWLNEERNHPAPWADFESDVYQMTLPRDWVFTWGVGNNDTNPVEVMEDWSNSMRTINRMFGYTEPRSKTTLYTIVDTSLRANVFSPGYPQSNSSFNPSSASQGGRANHDFLNGPRFADFVRLHELGHAEYFTKFSGEFESAVNLLYVFAHYYDLEVSIDQALARSVGNATRDGWSRDQNAIHWMVSTEFRNQVNNMSLPQQNFQQRGYTEYVDLAYMFGLDSLGRFWRQDHIDAENGISRTATRNSDPPLGRIQRLSLATGVNLDPLHHFWGNSSSSFVAQRTFMENNNLPLSRLIYDRLRHYQSVIPKNLAEFRVHRNLYFPHLNAADKALYDELNNNQTGWGQEEHDAAFANAERIINWHFPNGRPKISTFPHIANFNDNFSEWAHQEDDDTWDWRLHTGAAESVAFAGSVGSPDGSQYLLLEGHDSGNGDRASFMDNVYDMSALSGAELTFDYHMRGAFVDSLSVDVHDGTQWFLDVFILEGPQQTSATQAWESAAVDLSAFAGLDEVTIRLRGQKETFSGADISIDNLVVSELEIAIADSQSLTTNQDTPVNVTLTGNAPNNAAVTFMVNNQPTGGTLNGTAPNLTYVPNQGFTGVDSFTFLTTSGALSSEEATVSIMVFPTFDGTFLTDFGSSAVTNIDAASLDNVSPPSGIWSVALDEVNVANIVANSDGTDFALLVDESSQAGSANGTNVTLSLRGGAPFSDPLTVQFDLAAARGGNGKALTITGYGEDGTTIAFQMNQLLAQIPYTIQGLTPSGFQNLSPGISNFVSATAAYNPESLLTYTITLEGSSLLYDVEGSNPLTTTVLNGQTTLSQISWTISGTSSDAQGFWLDNVLVEQAEALSPFELWAATAFIGAPVGFDTGENGNSDGDRFTNIEEWVLLLNPLVTDEPVLATSGSSEGDDFVVEYSARNVGNPSVRAAWTNDLSASVWRYNGDGLTETLLETNGDIELRSASVPIDEEPKFIRLEIETVEE